MSWNINITSSQWLTTAATNQTVNIFYREGGTSGAYTNAGTIIFDSAGAIVGTPNPFIISGLSDAWQTAEVKAVNVCNNIDFIKVFINPNATLCVAAGITGSPALPDATVGTAYNYSFSLSGDEPFTLANVNKPAWMNIVVSGNNVIFSGTPGTSSSNIPVSFNITNCGGANTVPFNDSLNVNPSLQQGDATIYCQGGGTPPQIPFGISGSYTTDHPIMVTTPGTFHVVVHNDQAGSVNGYAFYYSGTVTVAATGLQFITVDVIYGGGGINQLYTLTWQLTGISVTDSCDGYSSYF